MAFSFNPIAAIVSGIQSIVKGAGDLFTSDEERMTLANAAKIIEQQPRLAAELTKQIKMSGEFQNALVQAANNLSDSKGNWFQSGWRPLIGWVCGLTWIFTLFIPTALNCIYWAIGCIQTGQIVPFPMEKHLLEALIWLSGGMLGILGGLRTFEKIKGVQDKH